MCQSRGQMHQTATEAVAAAVKVLKYLRPDSTPAGVDSHFAVRDKRAPFTFTGRHVARHRNPE